MRFLIIFFLFVSVSLFSQHNDWIVKYDDELSHNIIKANYQNYTLELLSESLNVYRLRTVEKVEASEVYKSAPFNNSIQHISPNSKIQYRDVEPNDRFFSDQYALDLIQVNKVWEETTGGFDVDGNEVVMAIIDDGYDILHDDLQGNFWINAQETPNDGIDNDNNGFIDDVMGVNIQDNTGIHPSISHGTQVAGIMGAKGDNELGITGMNWDGKLLLISGASNVGEIIKSLEYIFDLKKRFLDSNGEEGANIVVNNFSGGLKRVFPSDYPSWCEAYNLLGSVGVISVGAVANENFNVEIEGDMPTLCNSEFLLMVTNTNDFDTKVIDAAFGSVSVDLGAPGETILSSEINNNYDIISGTSASAPHVAGAIGLLYSIPCDAISDKLIDDPIGLGRLIKRAILEGVDPKETLSETVSGGRLNVFKSVLALNETCGETNFNKLSILSVKPNIISQETFYVDIEFETESFAEHYMNIVDSQGRLVISRRYNPALFGQRIFRFNLDFPLEPGLYFINISNGNSSAASQIIVPK